MSTEFVIVEGKCQFCGKGLQLQIDRSYHQMGDPRGLLEMAACNRCADFRTKRTRIEDAIKDNAVALIMTLKPEETFLNTTREAMVNLTKAYGKLIAKWLEQPPIWEETIVDQLMAKPKKFRAILKQYWKMYSPPQPDLMQLPPSDR